MKLLEELLSMSSGVWSISHDNHWDDTHLIIWTNIRVRGHEVLARLFVKD